METARPRTRTGNLTAALTAVAALELVINRLGGRLFFPRATLAVGGASRTAGLLSSAGSFLFQLTGVLALAVLVAALVGLVRRGELYPGVMRFTILLVSLVFVVFCGQALLLGQLPPRFFLFIETSFAFLALLTVAALGGGPTIGRVKLGVALFALPGVLHAAAILGAGFGRTAESGGAALARGGEWALIVATASAPFLLSPRPVAERRWKVPAVVALLLSALFIVGLAYRFDFMEASALYGLRIEMPPLASSAGVGYVVGLAGWAFAAAELLCEAGAMRLCGYGLVLLALGGYDAGSPVELSLSLLGLVSLTVGELRAAPYADRTRPRVSALDWKAFVGRLATQAGDGTDPEGAPPQAVVVDDGDVEVSRIQTHRRGYPVTLKLLRRTGSLEELDATLGSAGRAAPDASIERHRRWLARSPEQRLKLARMKTGDVVFDQKFSVHGGAPLEDAELRHRIARHQGDAVITLWRASAARYHLVRPGSADDAPPAFAGTVDGAAAVDSVVAILDTLADLLEASLPAAS